MLASGGFRFLSQMKWTPQYRDFLRASAAHILKGNFYFRDGHTAPCGHTVPADFTAICVATSPDPGCDDYVIEQLRELGIRHVRLDYSYDSATNHTARFLNALLDASFHVFLHLVQPLEEARKMEAREGQQRWRRFLTDTLDCWGERIELIEVGSTINRPRWAGYSLTGFTRAWKIAFHEARRRGLTLAGPNITDYEPFYTTGLLHLLKKRKLSPDIYTNNLFVERAIEPEAYDTKMLGRLLAPRIRYNLIKKARQLQQMAKDCGIDRVWSSYVTWTFPRINRILPNVEQKQADYLVRYMVLAAASGALDRVYWGPLISFREGLITDPKSTNPSEELVTFYHSTYGPRQHYQRRLAFDALKTFAALIPGRHFDGALSRIHGLEVHTFTSPQHHIHVVWTMNGRAADLTDLYSAEDLQEAEWLTLDGQVLQEQPSIATESPIYLRWPQQRTVRINRKADVLPALSINNNAPGGNYYRFRDASWQGMVLAQDREEAARLIAALHPEVIGDAARQALLRKARNAIWTVADPRNPQCSLAVKQPSKLRPHKKLIERFKPSKARRSWNGACELLRRGITSQKPVAYFERLDGIDLTGNWYICEFSTTKLSVKQFFTAYSEGASIYEGVHKLAFLSQLSHFLLEMHNRGVYFRDLSSGNVLVIKGPEEELQFSLIDTARAHFRTRGISLSQRLSDLKRICHKLHWSGRNEFMEMYLRPLNRPFSRLYRVPFYYYDLKAAIKRAMRKKSKSAPRRTAS